MTVTCFDLAFCAVMFVSPAQHEPFFFFEHPGAHGIRRDVIQAGNWAVQCHDEGEEADRVCYIRQYEDTGRLSGKSGLVLQYRAGGEAYLIAGAEPFLGTSLVSGIGLYEPMKVAPLLPGPQPDSGLASIAGVPVRPGTEQTIRIDDNPVRRSAENEPLVLDADAMEELRRGSTIAGDRHEVGSRPEPREMSLAGLSAVLDLVDRIVGGEPFELPADSIYKFYVTQGAAYQNLHRAVKFSLKARYEWERCPATDFDVDGAVEAALSELPGVAGEGFRDGFEDGFDSDLGYQLKIPQGECEMYFDALRQGPRVIKNLRYP